MRHKGEIAAAAVVLLAVTTSAVAEWTWDDILADDFNADPSANWSYQGVQNGSAQNLIRWNAGGYLDAEWDQSNNFVGTGDPYTIQPSRYSRALGQTLTDQDTFKVGAKVRISSVASTTEYYQVANIGLYNLAQMGPDRTMSDYFSGNTNLVKDACDFVEWNYFINNDDWYQWYPNTGATIGAHITGVDGDYTSGSSSDAAYFHDTDMGKDNYLPASTDLYVELSYFGSATDGDRRRAYGAVYTDQARTTILSVNGVEQYYWTQPLDDAKGFSVTDVAFFNYVGAIWAGANGTGSGAFDDAYVATGSPTIPGDANKDGKVNLADFTILKAYFGSSGGWDIGDFNADGKVNLADFTIFKAHYGEGTSAALPEPSALALSAFAAAGVLARRRSRKRHK